MIVIEVYKSPVSMIQHCSEEEPWIFTAVFVANINEFAIYSRVVSVFHLSSH